MDGLGRVPVLVALFGTCGVASAQLHSTVQLPTFQQFSMTTTVVVPDRGGVYAGGVNRSRQAISRRGLPLFPCCNRSFNRGSITNGVSVHASIHELEALDKQVISRWDEVKRKRLKSNIADQSPPADQQSVSIRELRKRVQAEEAVELAKARADYQAGLRWEEKGRMALAKAYYQRAIRQNVNNELKGKIANRLRVIAAPQLVSRSD